MFCSKCGSKNEDHSKFCYQCGSLLEVAVSVMGQQQEPAGFTYSESPAPISNHTYNQPEAAQQDTSNQQAPSYNQQAPSYNQQAPSYNQQTPSYNQQAPYPPYQQMPPYRQPVNQGKLSGKSKKPLFLTLAGVAAAAVIILCVTLLSPSRSGKVLDNILSAAKGTAEAKSVEFTVDLKEGRSRDKANGVIVYDLDKGKVEFDIETGNGSRSILYDGSMYDINDDEVWGPYDYSSEIDDLLEYYDEYKKGMDGLSKIDWEDAIDEAGLSRYVDTDKMAKCLKEFEKNLNSKSYFEKVCEEFSVEKTKDGTKYIFDVDVPKLVESLIDTFEPVIDMDIDDIKDEILDQVDVFDKLLVEITIKGDKLVEIHADISMEDWSGDMEQNEITITFENYGKASLDEDEIEKVIENSYKWD